ncbi:uncharacterized protein LOC116426154 [Nomia melanderi]|uniref:uncharacterized protein LOC116426154 n=1 Tax=Nomia melanderi TaxID=2448451 RepID=UPI001303F582|nr:uncharacterized protein LOC116426154 [Nomia melanderi]
MASKYKIIIKKHVKEASQCLSSENPEILQNSCNEMQDIVSTIPTSLSTREEYISMDQMNKDFKDLKLQAYNESNENEGEYLAGNINNVIETLNVVLVKPFSLDTLLYFETPLFLKCTSVQNSETKYVFLGYIDDIFGSVGEPMYSVTLKCNLRDMLNINTEVYYFPNDPNTLHINVVTNTVKI